MTCNSASDYAGRLLPHRLQLLLLDLLLVLLLAAPSAS